jgi:hypothetical protein
LYNLVFTTTPGLRMAYGHRRPLNQNNQHHHIANMPRSFQLPRALQLEDATVVEDERHQYPVIARDIVFGSYLTAACGISNDPPDEGVIVDLTVCNTTRYRCSPLTSYLPTLVDVPITDDYQITYLPDCIHIVSPLRT